MIIDIYLFEHILLYRDSNTTTMEGLNMNILAVTYLPREERSHTRNLLKMALGHLGTHTITTLNLLNTPPDLLDQERVMAYISRDYLGNDLTEAQKNLLAKMDSMTNQLCEADAVILATPMYNFSVPAMVKAWFDSVMLKGRTWDASADGYRGLLQGKKALVLMSSGGSYDGPMASWDHAMSLAKQEFTFMGFSSVDGVWLQGINIMPERLDEKRQAAEQEIASVLASW
ncbi:hypothetical protein BVX99_02815 [bacterium F16]|nr:hypothetical protein BVX99_02815 [bacterium F16]